MPILPRLLGDDFTTAMGRVTGCPNAGCVNTQPPRCAVPTSAGWMASYVCADCGTAWTTEWSDN